MLSILGGEANISKAKLSSERCLALLGLRGIVRDAPIIAFRFFVILCLTGLRLPDLGIGRFRTSGYGIEGLSGGGRIWENGERGARGESD